MLRSETMLDNAIMPVKDLAEIDQFVDDTLRIEDSPNDENMTEKMYITSAPDPQPKREQSGSYQVDNAPSTRQDPVQSFDGSPSPAPSPTTPEQEQAESQSNDFTIAGFSGYVVLLFVALGILIYNWR